MEVREKFNEMVGKLSEKTKRETPSFEVKIIVFRTVRLIEEEFTGINWSDLAYQLNISESKLGEILANTQVGLENAFKMNEKGLRKLCERLNFPKFFKFIGDREEQRLVRCKAYPNFEKVYQSFKSGDTKKLEQYGEEHLIDWVGDHSTAYPCTLLALVFYGVHEDDLKVLGDEDGESTFLAEDLVTKLFAYKENGIYKTYSNKFNKKGREDFDERIQTEIFNKRKKGGLYYGSSLLVNSWAINSLTREQCTEIHNDLNAISKKISAFGVSNSESNTSTEWFSLNLSLSPMTKAPIKRPDELKEKTRRTFPKKKKAA